MERKIVAHVSLPRLACTNNLDANSLTLRLGCVEPAHACAPAVKPPS